MNRSKLARGRTRLKLVFPKHRPPESVAVVRRRELAHALASYLGEHGITAQTTELDRRKSSPLPVIVPLVILAAADRHLIGFESGAKAWLRIGDFVIEPAEVVALAVVVFAAKRLATTRFSRKLAFDPTILLFLSGIPFLLLTLDATLGTKLVEVLVLDRLPGLNPSPTPATDSLEEINRFALPYLGITGH